jgi:hypothetical protein
MGIEADDTGLIGLGNVGEDAVNHRHEHAVLQGVTGVLDDGDDLGSLVRNGTVLMNRYPYVCAVRSHVDQITSRPVGELDGKDGAFWSDDISNMGDAGSTGCSEILSNG